jgi:hypothetical protein
MKVIWDMVTGEYEERSPGTAPALPPTNPLPGVGDAVEPRLVPLTEVPRANRPSRLPGVATSACRHGG